MSPVLRPVLAPAAIAALTLLSVAAIPALPPTLSGLPVLLPYVVLLAASAIALWFNRGRACVAAVSMLAAYAGYRYSLDLGAFPAKAAYTALAVLVPVNVLAALALPERGVYSHHNHRWLLLGAAELLLVLWVASAGRSPLSGTAWVAAFDHWSLHSPPTPLAGRILFAVAFGAAMWRAHPKPPATAPRALDIGLAAALAAFFVAAEWVASPAVFAAFMAAAGALLLVAVLQETHRLAFADELTGLPSRRALQEHLPGLGPVCAVAMADVDHFKKFNDTHGHDIGDQVLKLVAARLAEVGGGGVAFRYGGEEFCVVFRDCTAAEAVVHLEAIRASIEEYQMAIRNEERPRDAEAGSRLRGATLPQKVLSVTISIGVAERAGLEMKPMEAIKAADEALYRAKAAGRNRVAR
jgi:diguanylate cyclase (GGDEF)-like protein